MHIPVLLNEVLQYLDPKPNENFIDCTVGEGGHALAILKMIAPGGRVLGIDRDNDMAERLRARVLVMGMGDRFIVHHGNFSDLGDIAKSYKFPPAQGILFDFGMSTYQLEESGAGFSFQNIEPLDMRFDRTKDTKTAATILNSWPEESIRRVIDEFGEERYARRIAREIVASRKKSRIMTTDQLVSIISRAVPYKQQGIHFATRTFQALRIAVNSELENLEKGISEAINLLSSGGKITAISFHSLEDRRVKNIFRENSKVEGGPPSLAFGELRKGKGLLKIIVKKPVIPSPREIRGNPRARSAKLRVAEKI
jgi:16S rRNA (cytosine1402-N4)-methyltransferase